jgi:AAA15 family ATPase/GTPase
MIIDFSIKNFKGIREKVSLSFLAEDNDHLANYYIIEPIQGIRLLKVGIIYGPNGSGKSTIIEALDFLRDLVRARIKPKDEPLDFEPFLFDDHSRYENSEMELNFISNRQRYRYYVSFNRKVVLNEELYRFPNKALLFERTTDTEKQVAYIKFGEKAKIKKASADSLINNTLSNSTVLSAFLHTNIDSEQLREVTNWFTKELKDSIDPKMSLRLDISRRLIEKKASKNNILKFLKKASFAIEDVDIEAKEKVIDPQVREMLDLMKKQSAEKFPNADLSDFDKIIDMEIAFRHYVVQDGEKKTYLLDYKNESEGTKRYFQFAGLLDMLIREQHIIPIDEVESSLHPDLLKHFLLLHLVNSKESQLLVTTHYRELLLEKDILRRDAIWFTDKRADGTTDLYSLADFDTSVIRDTTSIFNAYKTGKLGAVPVLLDYYLDMDIENISDEEN